MASKESLSQLIKWGIRVEKCHYLQNDALASEEDLKGLFETLSRYKDSQGRNPTITANVIMANPDFEKIEASDFAEYSYELFTKTLERYPGHRNSFQLWKQGIREGFFHPQFHGREHLQVMRWLRHLQDPNSETRKAFNLQIFGMSTTVTSEQRKSYLAAYDWDDQQSRTFVMNSIPDGLSLFEELFGYRSLSAIAPNYVWHPETEQILKDHGVRYLQGTHVQRSPEINGQNFNKIHHFMGQRNRFGQRYLVRNCAFEPSSNPEVDWVDRCLESIRTAFLWSKPAVIEMHRVNFIGFINPENRDENLKMLAQLLQSIIQTWPEVEFMTSDQLGKIIEEYE
jgi:hypothetical protein